MICGISERKPPLSLLGALHDEEAGINFADRRGTELGSGSHE